MSSSVSDAYNHTAHTSFCFMWVFFFFIEQISCTKLILREHNDKNFVFFIDTNVNQVSFLKISQMESLYSSLNSLTVSSINFAS